MSKQDVKVPVHISLEVSLQYREVTVTNKKADVNVHIFNLLLDPGPL